MDLYLLRVANGNSSKLTYRFRHLLIIFSNWTSFFISKRDRLTFVECQNTLGFRRELKDEEEGCPKTPSVPSSRITVTEPQQVGRRRRTDTFGSLPRNRSGPTGADSGDVQDHRERDTWGGTGTTRVPLNTGHQTRRPCLTHPRTTVVTVIRMKSDNNRLTSGAGTRRG